MKQKTLIALLLSLCVYPGVGHLYLKRKVAGLALSLVVTLLLLFLVILFEVDLLHFLQASAPHFSVTHVVGAAKEVYESKKAVYSAGSVVLGFLWVGAACELLWREKN